MRRWVGGLSASLAGEVCEAPVDLWINGGRKSGGCGVRVRGQRAVDGIGIRLRTSLLASPCKELRCAMAGDQVGGGSGREWSVPGSWADQGSSLLQLVLLSQMFPCRSSAMRGHGHDGVIQVTK